MKKVLSAILIISLFWGLAPAAYAEETSALSAWTETSYQNIFKDATQGSSQEINLVMAKNEYESAQIVLKSTESFTIQSVTFSNLVSDDEQSFADPEEKLTKQKKQVNCKFTCFFRGWDVTGLGYNKTARRWPCGLLTVEISGIEPLTCAAVNAAQPPGAAMIKMQEVRGSLPEKQKNLPKGKSNKKEYSAHRLWWR